MISTHQSSQNWKKKCLKLLLLLLLEGLGFQTKSVKCCFSGRASPRTLSMTWWHYAKERSSATLPQRTDTAPSVTMDEFDWWIMFHFNDCSRKIKPKRHCSVFQRTAQIGLWYCKKEKNEPWFSHYFCKMNALLLRLQGRQVWRTNICCKAITIMKV